VQVRATAVLGVPTPERLVYDNLDLLVHPLAVSFTDQQLNQLWVRRRPMCQVCMLHADRGTVVSCTYQAWAHEAVQGWQGHSSTTAVRINLANSQSALSSGPSQACHPGMQEYFFPKEEDPAGGSGAKAGGGGQELWMKSALSRTLKRGGGSGSGRGGRSNTAAAAVAGASS
jgi:hypothetical protein